ncbi:hypothetical protein HO173_012362 [Letharia columbiana]|uniref:RING-type domain-containing protein n=1 Tax=Letharia columbiana TaxID=112416 RepID=A0A8H6FG94_9LECA|nr:uncharacterized protein HO173_012362 [Letharia columbiana]KAF6226759.1 hypothetical protein HO173_012362 [Letharia columbiana]
MRPGWAQRGLAILYGLHSAITLPGNTSNLEISLLTQLHSLRFPNCDRSLRLSQTQRTNSGFLTLRINELTAKGPESTKAMDLPSVSERLAHIESPNRDNPIVLANVRTNIRGTFGFDAPGPVSQHQDSDRSINRSQLRDRRNEIRSRLAQARVDAMDTGTLETSNIRAKTFLESLPVLSLTDLLEDKHDCPICIEPYQDPQHSESPVRLPCNHIIGKDCLLSWLTSSALNTKNNTCPICRAVLFERNKVALKDQLGILRRSLSHFRNAHGPRISMDETLRRNEEHERTHDHITQASAPRWRLMQAHNIQ